MQPAHSNTQHRHIRHRHPRHRTPGSPQRSLAALFLAVLILPSLFMATPARALVRFDFEQKYFVHSGHQTWDFSVVRHAGEYHLYYHTALNATSSTRHDSIWHAVSPDLIHWNDPQPVLHAGTAAWDTSAIWAPDIFRDDVGQRWVLAYTGADATMNQSMGLAYSSDLYNWTPEPANPVLEPTPGLYIWGRDRTWSDFRDPFVWREDGSWHVLLTAAKWIDGRTGVLYHGVSDDLLDWQDAGPFFVHDGTDEWRVLESPQHHVLGGRHHLLCGEFDTSGISHLSAAAPESLTMATRTFIDGGYAPELDIFDPGIPVLSRIIPFILPSGTEVTYVIRWDTVQVSTDGAELTVLKPHPLNADWEIHEGVGAAGNPTFGANPLWRGEPHPGHEGHGWFGSGEYYQGPLSGYGFPGGQWGGNATCDLLSRPFVVSGLSMDLLVGGAQDPEHLYVALVDAATDSVLRKETGTGDPVMQPRSWDLTDLRGRNCRIRIHDSATGPGDVINLDEIVERPYPSSVGITPAAPAPELVRIYPNPANPRVQIRYRVVRSGPVRLRVHDLRGRKVWSSPWQLRQAGEHTAAWDGQDLRGRAAASGTYLLSVETADGSGARGKFSLIR